MLGTLVQEFKILIGKLIYFMPWMESHRVPLARLRVEILRSHRDEGSVGIKMMGVNVDDRCHGTGS